MLKSIKNTRYMQYLAALTGTTFLCASTMFTTWPSPMLPLLTSANSPIGVTLTEEEGSWIVSSFLITSNLNLFLIPWTVEKFGRKLSLLGSIAPILVSWIIIFFARSFVELLIGRLIAGFALGICTVAISMYNGEIAEADIRGKVATSYTIMRLFGNFLVLLIGPFVSYKQLVIICATVPIIGFILYYPMPESPYFLIKSGKKDEAIKSLKKLSRADATNTFIDKEIMQIEETVENDMRNRSTFKELFTKKEYRKALYIMLGVKTLQQLNGSIAIDSYLQSIIADTDSIISPEMSSVIFGAIQIPAALIAAYCIDKFGRKAILFVSAITCGIAFAGEGYYFYLQYLHQDVDSLSWLPTTGLIVYATMNTLGCSSIPYVLLGELFPTNIKDIAVALFTTYGGLLAFAVSKFYEPLSSLYGRHATFWTFSSVSFLGAIFVIVFLPETKGKTFAQIQLKLNRKKKEDNMSNNASHEFA